MTNNLAKIAKDLRAFAKRCKDVHYSDSLLISFILSGILSLASISFSDTFDNLSDSQKEAAMDSINEMRQQINYARKDNDKLIKGSSLELVKLMEQGDQVVKSPWGSQQFGFGYTYNSWGTSFKGRGGKQNDIKYRRTNDLTKYVYDPNLHEYGATNLHIKRNKEPDVLVINPANVHKSYTPPTVTRMDAMTMIDGPQFNPNINGLNSSYYNYGFSTNPTRTYNTRSVTPTSLNARANNGVYTSNAHSNAADISNGGSYNTSNAAYHNNYTTGDNSATGPATTGNITKISGNFYNGNIMFYTEDSNSLTNGEYNGTTVWSRSYGGSEYVTVNGNFIDISPSGQYDSGLHTRDATYEGWFRRAGGTFDHNITGPTYRPTSIYNSTGLTVNSSNFWIESQDSGIHNGIYSTSNLTIDNTVARREKSYDTSNNSGRTTTGYFDRNRWGTIFNISGSRSGVTNPYSYSNGIYSGGGDVTTNSDTYFNVGGYFNYTGNSPHGPNGDNGGRVADTSNFVQSGSYYNNGINMGSGAGKATVNNTTFNIAGSGNGILINSGINTNKVTGSTFNVTSGNGININSGGVTDVTSSADKASSFTVGNGNGIYAAAGTKLDNVTATFSITGTNSNGILKNTDENTKVAGSTFTVGGTGSTGITYNGGSTAEIITGSTFNVNGRTNATNGTTSGINMINTEQITVNPNTDFNVNGSAIGIEVHNNAFKKRKLYSQDLLLPDGQI